MEFQPLDLDQASKFISYFNDLDTRTCDYTAGGMFMWRDYYHMEYCIDHDTLFTRQLVDGQLYYNLPLSDHIPASLDRLIRSVTADGSSVKFWTIPENQLPLFSPYSDKTVENLADYSDYLYDARELFELSGSKYRIPRNHIHQFERSVSDWCFVPIDDSNIPDVIHFFLSVYDPLLDDSFEGEENNKTLEVLKNFRKYNATGGILLSGKAIIGFTIGEILHDTLFVHIEKADRSYRGAYQKLSHEFLASFHPGSFTYVNREEDMGDPGLRRSKESYNPIMKLQKYLVEVKGSYATAH